MTEEEAKYRKSIRVYLWLFVLYVPVVFAAAVGLFKVFGTFTPGFVIAGTWAATWVLFGVRAAYFRYRWKHPVA
jgi:hypothetical protein